jgi:hypothetical protein
MTAVVRQMMSAARNEIHGSAAPRSRSSAFRAWSCNSQIRRVWKERKNEL